MNTVQPMTNRHDAAYRLFFFPYGGGGASTYHSWGHGLPPDIDAWTVQPPGREDRLMEEPIGSFDRMLDLLAEEIVDKLDRPYAFFGHCMGAMFGWELARRLQVDGAPQPAHLFLSGSRALHLQNSGGDMHTLSNAELTAVLSEMGGTPEHVLQDPELMELMLPMVRADIRIMETYVFEPGEVVACPISAFGGDLEEAILFEHLAGWGDLTTSGCDVRMFPGDHFFINDARDALIDIIAGRLLGAADLRPGLT